MQVVDVYSNSILLSIQKPHQILLDIAVGCNKASFGKNTEGLEQVYGDPTEIGLLQFALSHSTFKKDFELSHGVITEFPFESDRKRMSIVRLNGE